ncbi:TIP41-like protein [Miscanthus floridulus]|uniref:TIP41-like protein n=1 Tax=Miscanthus floridulus TaxID=154761 RepID=UPI003458ADCB
MCYLVSLLKKSLITGFFFNLFSCSKPSDQVMLDYDYTFTTPYCGSDAVVVDSGTTQTSLDGCSTLCWEDTNDRIDLVALSEKEPILFYEEVILYEDGLADNGISFLTVRVRVMTTAMEPNQWYSVNVAGGKQHLLVCLRVVPPAVSTKSASIAQKLPPRRFRHFRVPVACSTLTGCLRFTS